MPTLTLPASLESLSALRHFLTEAAVDCGREEQAIYDLKLAVDEIATNAIIHGRAGSRPPGTLTLRAETTPEAFTVILEDYGGPFDPRTAPHHAPPGGWGVQLALKGADRFDYHWDGERNHYTFVLSRLEPLAGAES